MTFSNKLSDAMRLAEPGTYGGTFGLSSLGLAGTLSVGSDGVVYWTPDGDDDAGTYALAATYNYSGGLQMKALSLTIETDDRPPAYTPWYDCEAPVDVHGGTYNFVSAAVCWASDAEQTTLSYSFAAGATVVPSGAYLDSNGHVGCTFGTGDAGTVYDFFIVATDSSGKQFRGEAVPGTQY